MCTLVVVVVVGGGVCVLQAWEGGVGRAVPRTGIGVVVTQVG